MAFGWLSECLAEETSCPKSFLEFNQYFALTSYCNTIGQSNNAFSKLVFFNGKTRRPWFDLFIHWLKRQITNTYRNHFSRSYENCSTVSVISTYLFKSYNAHQSTQSSHISMWKVKECKKLVNLQDTIK